MRRQSNPKLPGMQSQWWWCIIRKTAPDFSSIHMRNTALKPTINTRTQSEEDLAPIQELWNRQELRPAAQAKGSKRGIRNGHSGRGRHIQALGVNAVEIREIQLRQFTMISHHKKESRFTP
ncbi:hypothetical protein DHEL01_v207432 [Diaporthe helianthi]|uniref:Uncharacterized protein n=1 Tax=Diaporthe helianthi TaxID=158607 RepID=A0A2P5HV95_DIAHE|nr:hypothetical protein DHEL01_v207432 [Diaporthe helianthi]